LDHTLVEQQEVHQHSFIKEEKIGVYYIKEREENVLVDDIFLGIDNYKNITKRGLRSILRKRIP